MAEEESDLELGSFQQQLASLFGADVSDAPGLQSKSYCASFCQLVEEHTGRWQVPLPQLQLLRSALCDFVRGAASFPSDCEHVRYTLSSLALSVFELLLFFGKDEFLEDPLKDILDSFQECHSSLVRYQNVYLLQVRQIIKDGGPWASPVLQSILKELEQPQEEVDRYLSSEVSVFFELRVRYLLACERIKEAMALSQKCSQHPTAGRHLYFKQAFLTCLCKTSQQERLFKELLEIDGKDAVEILCMAENEEKDEVLLELCRGFLLQQLREGDMYYLWDLVFIWCKVCLRVKASKHDFLEECKEIILTATNVKAIFPFMKVILAEDLGKDGLLFCIELCASALQTDFKNDPVTKSLICKAIAYLLPNDLEMCRACALLVFFLERSVEAYKTVFLLYTHPDQEYYVDSSPVGNHMRFELIRLLKKELLFDPEFWSLLNIKTHCLKLMSDKEARAALCEIMEEDKWVPSYCVREHCKCHVDPEKTVVTPLAQSTSAGSQDSETEENHVRPPSNNESSNSLPPKKRGRKPGTKIIKNLEPFPVRRSFRQLDFVQNHSRQLSGRPQRFMTRQTENKTLKRRGRKPRWLLEELAAQAENSAPRDGKKRGRKPKQLNILKDLSVDRPVIEITMDLSYPDNEVDLPADAQCLPVSKTATSMAELSLEASKVACQGTAAQSSDKTSNSLLQLESNKSASSWREKATTAEEFVFQMPHEVAFVKFHTYAKVPEEAGVAVSDQTDSGVMAAPSAAQHEGPFQVPVPVQNRSEPLEVKSVVTPLAPAVPQISVPDTGCAYEASVLERYSLKNLLSVTPIEDNAVPKSAVPLLDSSTVCLPKRETTSFVADTVSAPDDRPESDDTLSPPENTPNSTNDHTNAIKNGPAKENHAALVPDSTLKIPTNTTITHQTTPQRTADIISTPKKLTDGQENAPDATRHLPHLPAYVSEVASQLETPAHPQEQGVHQTAENEVPQAIRTESNHAAPATTSLADVSVLHRCRLCGIQEYKSSLLLKHAFWHYRAERKCMFGHCFKSAFRPLCHFKQHIKNLKVDDGHVEEKAKDLTETDARPDQTPLHGVLPKKAKPGLAQIKSRLLMRLKARSNAQAQAKAESGSGAKGKPLKQRFKKQPASSPELEGRQEEEEMAKDESNKGSIPRTKIRYMTRGLVKKSESRGRLVRTRLARKAKTGRMMVDGDGVLKESTVPKVNGVIKKKRKVSLQEESRQVTAKNEDAESNEKMESSEGQQVSDGAVVERTGLNVPKGTLKPGIKKKRSMPDEQNDDVKMIKQRKVKNGLKKETEADKQPATVTEQGGTVGNITDSSKMENGTEAQSNETSEQVAKKKSVLTCVKCPANSCTFNGRAKSVLSHMLFHHPEDRKDLEFFYNLANEKCLFCARRIWSPQHFFDHVVSHKGNLKHPCYHLDCKERFKTRLELTNHMLHDHRPLRAVCCFPGCSVLCATPQNLYSHERDHYRVIQTILKKVQSVPSSGKAVEELDGVNTGQEAQLTKAPQQQRSENTEAEGPLTLNKSSVNYTSKNPRLVNGHGLHRPETRVKLHSAATREQEPDLGKVSIKPFVRPPPSAYLDETYISMPKRWKGPQTVSQRYTPVNATAAAATPTKKHCCPRCSVTFASEEELQAHRGKCTSLFGFDSDDESAS